MTRALFLLGFSVLLTSCSHATPTEAPAPAAPKVAIATIKTRDGKVTLLGGGPDLRVMLRDVDGNVVADDASLDELRTRDPAAWIVVTRALAQNGTYLDASR